MQKKVLCLDGGGVRGKYSFEICKLIAISSKIPISSLFDLVVGVSVGAWIGAIIAFGFLDEERTRTAILNQIFDQLTDTFRSKNKFAPTLLEPRYNGDGKRKLLTRIFGSKTLKEAITPFMVVCTTIGGHARRYESWNPKDYDISMVDLLDATSAAPIYFPPVNEPKQNEYLVDGGTIANKPLNSCLMSAMSLFQFTAKDLDQIKMLSIGTQSTCDVPIDKKDIHDMGAVTWISLGLFDILTGVADDTPIQLTKMLLGEKNFIRIHCECGNIRLDDLSEHANHQMHDSVVSTWGKHGSDILKFLDAEL